MYDMETKREKGFKKNILIHVKCFKNRRIKNMERFGFVNSGDIADHSI